MKYIAEFKNFDPESNAVSETGLRTLIERLIVDVEKQTLTVKEEAVTRKLRSAMRC